MKNIAYIIVVAMLLCLTVTPARGASPTTLNWTAPTTNSDGTPLTDLAGYKIYCGIKAGTYASPKNVGNVLTYPLSSLGLTQGVNYCAVTAYDTSGNESVKSNEVSFTFDNVAPAAPSCSVN